MGMGVGNWTTVIVPKELREKIKTLSLREGKPQWQVISEAISFKMAENTSPRVKESLSEAEKMSWYIVKAVSSIGELKASPTEDNLSRLEKTLTQVSERLGVSVSTVNLVLRIARSYVGEKSDEKRKTLRRDLNAVAKMLVLDIMRSSPSGEDDLI